MRKITLGRTGIEISVMGQGTMYFGSKVEERTSFRLMDLYLEPTVRAGSVLDAPQFPGCDPTGDRQQ